MLGSLVEDHPNGSFTYFRGMLTGSSHESHPLSEWALRPTRYASFLSNGRKACKASYENGSNGSVRGARGGDSNSRRAVVEVPRPTDPPHCRRQTGSLGTSAAHGRRKTG